MMESFEQNNCGAAGQNKQSQGTDGGWVHTDSSVRPMTPHLFRADCKAEGRNALLGHLGTAVGASAAFWGILILMRLLIMNVLPEGNGLLITLLAELLTLFVCVFSGIYEYGLTCIFMKLQYQQEAVFSDLFLGIHENQDKLVKISLVQGGLGMLAMLPSLIASFYAGGAAGFGTMLLLMAAGTAATVYISLGFYPSFYILLDYPNLNAGEVIKRSWRMMKGHKKELLMLELSFLPYLIPTVLSFGLAGLWVFAYIRSTMAAYYRKRIE